MGLAAPKTSDQAAGGVLAGTARSRRMGGKELVEILEMRSVSVSISISIASATNIFYDLARATSRRA